MKPKKNFPRITIERVLTDEEGHITAIDIHDEKFGDAMLLRKVTVHFHGFLNDGKYSKSSPL